MPQAEDCHPYISDGLSAMPMSSSPQYSKVLQVYRTTELGLVTCLNEYMLIKNKF